MKMLGLEIPCICVHTLQAGSPFLSGGWVNPSRTEGSAKTHGCSPRVKPKCSPIPPQSAQVFQLLGAVPTWETAGPMRSVVEAGGVRVPQDTCKLQESPFRDQVPPGKAKWQKRCIAFGAQKTSVARAAPNGPTPNPPWLWQRVHPSHGHHQVPLLWGKG